MAENESPAYRWYFPENASELCRLVHAADTRPGNPGPARVRVWDPGVETELDVSEIGREFHFSDPYFWCTEILTEKEIEYGHSSIDAMDSAPSDIPLALKTGKLSVRVP